MNYRKILRIFFILFVISLLFTTACFKEKSPAKKPDKIKLEPKTLREIQEKIEEVIKEYEKVFFKQVAPTPQSSNEQEQIKEEKSKNQKEKTKSKEEADKPLEPDWERIEKTITKLHNYWNEFQREISQKGATTSQIEDFSEKLNELTMTLTKKELYPGLLVANELYEKAATFEKLYEPKITPDLKKTLYFIRKATYQGLQNDLPSAEEVVLEAKDLWERSQHKTKDREKAKNAQFAIKELHQAIKEQDPNLIKIKYHIAEQNIKDIIKKPKEE